MSIDFGHAKWNTSLFFPFPPSLAYLHLHLHLHTNSNHFTCLAPQPPLTGCSFVFVRPLFILRLSLWARSKLSLAACVYPYLEKNEFDRKAQFYSPWCWTGIPSLAKEPPQTSWGEPYGLGVNLSCSLVFFCFENKKPSMYPAVYNGRCVCKVRMIRIIAQWVRITMKPTKFANGPLDYEPLLT